MQKYTQNVMCTRLIDLQPLPGEVFLNVTPDILPGVYPYYKISNYGRLFNIYTNTFATTKVNGNRYVHYNLSGYPTSINIDAHRLEMMVFCPRPDAASLQINHKDGIKYNNHISNLEWCTRSENILDAYRTGLMAKGENKATAVMTNDQVRYICELLETGKYTNKQIAKMAGCNEHNVADVKSNDNRWADITKDYTFSYKRYRCFTDEDAVRICVYFQNNPRPFGKTKADHCRDAIAYAGLDNSVFDSVRKIYDRKQYTHISCNFTF